MSNSLIRESGILRAVWFTNARPMWIENPLAISAGAFPILECIHIAGFALSIGMTALVDFRLLGFGLQKQTPAQIARAFEWWMLGGLIVAVFSGLLIFSTDARYVLSELVFSDQDGMSAAGHCFQLHNS